jgi:alginate O-acetyltransferase complex protein AlgI
MLFPTFGFALFFLPVFLASWMLQGQPVARKLLLLAASYVFYAAWSPYFCALILASSLGNHAAAHIVARLHGKQKTAAVSVAIAADLAVLGWFKYYGFFALSLDSLLSSLGLPQVLPLLDIILPVGVSFFTFHAISYVVDVYRGHTPPARSTLDALLYVAFFPHLVAGPIVRASYFLPQMQKEPEPDDIKAVAAVVLILWGLVKKVLIADCLASELVDPAFMDPSAHGAVDLWLAAYGYAAQIFCDFSAYTDMATGIAALLGYRFPPNFNRPYGSASLSEFWTRWHISLSSWLRDYLYIPLGGNRHGSWRTCANLMATMILGGLWHGANWTFLLWGLLHGTALVAARLCPWRLPKVLGILLTFHVVCLGWILFRSPDLATAWTYLCGMVRSGDAENTWTAFPVSVTAGALLLHLLPAGLPARVSAIAGRLPWPVLGMAAGAAAVAIAAMGPDGTPPFIYFAF